MQKLMRVFVSLLVVLSGGLAVLMAGVMAESVPRVYEPDRAAMAAVLMAVLGMILVITGGHLVKEELRPVKIKS